MGLEPGRVISLYKLPQSAAPLPGGSGPRLTHGARAKPRQELDRSRRLCRRRSVRHAVYSRRRLQRLQLEDAAL